MSKKIMTLMTGTLVLACYLALPAFAADDEDAKPKHTIKEVMKKAMKGPLLKKVVTGDASEEEVKELHAMLVSLSKSKPKKGESDSWKKLTDVLVKAGKAVVDGDEKAGVALKKAADCKGCHESHK